MNESTTRHPLVHRYLEDLHRLLEGVEPVERAEVLDGIREHLDGSLTDGASEDEVRVALAELGTPESVAEEAYAGRPRATVSAPAGPPVPTTSRGWLPLVAAAFQLLAGFTALMVTAGMGGMVSSATSGPAVRMDSDGTTETVGHATTVTHFDGNPIGFVFGILASAPFWLVVVLLVGLSALWSVREKAALVALVPLASLALSLLPVVGYALFGIHGVFVGSWTALALTVFGGGALVVVLTRRALQRSAVLTHQH